MGKYQLVIYCVIIFYNINVFGQQVKKDEILLPSPNVGSLFRAGNIPINKSNGTINIDVPIFSSVYHGVPIDVNLSYNTRGIKVNEISSEAGLGWNLSHGGAITKTIQGRTDNMAYPYYNYVDQYKNIDPMTDAYYRWNREVFATTVGEVLDMEPDIYNYNFDGYSGKFYLFPNGKFYTMPASALKIEFQNYPMNGKWIITAPTGTKYVFGYTLDNARSAMDNSSTAISSSGNYSSTYSGPSSWFLVETILNNNEKIKYYYSPKIYNYQADIGEEYRHGMDCGSELIFNDIFNNVSTVEIDSIRYNDVKIQFLRELNRIDLPGATAITSIKVFDNLDLFKQYNFEYFYNAPSNVASNSSSGLGSPYNLRLFLKSIKLSNDNSNELYREFEYNLNSGVPSRFTKSRDHWGFYNSAGNTTLIPPSSFFKNHPVVGTISFSGAEKKAVDYYAKEMILKSVKYPTGGKSMFSYEGNRVKNVSTSLPFIIDKSEQVEYENGVTDTTYFSVSNPNSMDFNSRAIISYSINNDELNIIHGGCAELIIKDINSGYHVKIDRDYINYNPSTVHLPIGDYMMYFRWTNGAVNCYQSTDFYVYASLDWKQNNNSNEPIVSDMMVGGLRISEIRNVDANLKTISKKTFLYNEDNSDFSSGYLEFDPSYRAKRIGIGGQCIQLSFDTNSHLPTVGSNNSIVLYNVVSEFDSLETGREIKTTDYFTTSHDYAPLVVESYPTGVRFGVDSYDWRRGRPIKHKAFSLSGSQYHLEEEEDFEYVFEGTQTPGLTSDELNAVGSEQWDFADLPPPRGFEFTEYTITNEWTYLSKSLKKSFRNNQVVKEAKGFFYQNPLHRQLTNETDSTSDIKLLSAVKIYPHEMVSSGRDPNGVYQGMIDRNEINPVVEEVSKKNNQQIRLVRTNYFQPYSGLYLPQTIETQLKVSDSPEIVKRYHKYDSRGNILCVSNEHGLHVTYLWSYNGRYPILEIKNTDYDSVKISLNEIVISNFSNLKKPDIVAIHDFVTPLKVNLAHTQITTFSYKPLVGMTSTTDAKGMTSYYEYDSFQRLKYIKDQNGNIVKSYDYHYKP